MLVPNRCEPLQSEEKKDAKKKFKELEEKDVKEKLKKGFESSRRANKHGIDEADDDESKFNRDAEPALAQARKQAEPRIPWRRLFQLRVCVPRVFGKGEQDGEGRREGEESGRGEGMCT